MTQMRGVVNMPADEIIIRDTCMDDAAAIAVLMTDLGYPTSTVEMKERMEKITIHPDHKTIVAVVNNEIVGVAGLCKGIFYELNGGYLRILAFVIKQGSRNKGIGKHLLQASENWAAVQGLKTIFINSGNRDARIAAHVFYKKMGYEIKSSGFVKYLI